MEFKQVSWTDFHAFAARRAFIFYHIGEPILTHKQGIEGTGPGAISKMQTAVGALFVSSN